MKRLVYGMIVIAVLLGACSNEEESVTEEVDEEPKEENVVEKEDVGENQYPLTGLYTEEPVDNRIVSVMINNHSQARPQSGIAEADVVFEVLAESSITRFLALYQSELPQKIGPVRSAREYYFDLSEQYDALYVYHGAATFIDEMIRNENIPFLNGAIHDNDGVLFQRESFRQAPHNSYLLGSAVYEMAENKGYDTKVEHDPLPFLDEEEIEMLEGEEAEQIEIIYSEQPMEIVEYQYDRDAGNYQRYSNHEETVDYETGDVVTVENIFIVETHHEVIDAEGRRAIDLESGGNAYFIQNGVANAVEWKNLDGRIVPVKDGKRVGFVPGKTWVNIVPANPSMSESVTITGEEI